MRLAPADRLQRMLSGLVMASETVPRACFLAKATAELAVSDPDVAAIAQQTYRDLENLLVAVVAQAQSAGAISARLNARAAGRHLLVVTRGLEAIAQSGMETAVLQDAIANVVATVFSLPSRTTDA